MKTLCVFAGSSAGNHQDYQIKTKELGKFIASNGYQLVYGGSKVGLMGEVANEVLLNGGKVIGVMPNGLFKGETAHNSLTQFIKVNSMHERKAKMNELADGFIALPGGIGTFEELFEVLCWSQIGIHKKPIGLFNINHYYDPLVNLITNSIQAGFAKESTLKLLSVSDDPEELLSFMTSYTPPTMEQKWKKINF
ncbi:TIGR00730 family Rossman fold protein [Bacillus sp. 03113]|uniref:LOG family protein n=1 Tax=Bacillus sp. 03113 TaxID=2578211 RepID=UPI00114236DE|nr:TIGR00730 family Rossman fold protein [Bacillus sp. 03113]